MIEGGTLITAVKAAAAGVDALHVLELVLAAVSAMLLPGQVVLGLRATALVLADPVAHVHHALLPVAAAARGRGHARVVEAGQLVAACTAVFRR